MRLTMTLEPTPAEIVSTRASSTRIVRSFAGGAAEIFVAKRTSSATGPRADGDSGGITAICSGNDIARCRPA